MYDNRLPKKNELVNQMEQRSIENIQNFEHHESQFYYGALNFMGRHFDQAKFYDLSEG